MKRCTACKIKKEETEFYIHSTNKKPEAKCKKCKAKYKAKWYTENKQTELFSIKYRNAIYTAKQRNLVWDIPRELWDKLTAKGCTYCHNKVNPKDRIGLDRIDNSKGYLVDNVIPACKSCNIGRNANFTVDEWQIAVAAILEYRDMEG